MKFKPPTRCFWFLTVITGGILTLISVHLSRPEILHHNRFWIPATASIEYPPLNPRVVAKTLAKDRGEPKATLTGEAAKAELGKDGQYESLGQSHPEMVAQKSAPADRRDPSQCKIVKTRLLASFRTAADFGTHDRETLEIIGTWEKDANFATVKLCLATMRQRLTAFVREGQASD